MNEGWEHVTKGGWAVAAPKNKVAEGAEKGNPNHEETGANHLWGDLAASGAV